MTIQNKHLSHKSKGSLKKRIALLTIVLLIVVALILLILEKTDTTHLFHTPKPAPTASSYTKGETKNPNGSIKQNGSTGDNKQNGSSTAGAQKSDENTVVTLLDPSGDFVSNHHPNLSNSPAPNVMTSVCTSTPGATCVITFTKGSITKSLDQQTTDSGGSAYWNWKLQDIGLTEGSWKIKATAKLGSQVKTAEDALTLEVAE